MHYINLCVLPYIIMKHLISICIALFITASYSAQFPDPCSDNIASSWNGVGPTVPFNAFTGVGAIYCDSIYAGPGYFKHIQGNFTTSIPASWANDEVYGLVGTGSIKGIASGEVMSASVLETRLSVIENSLQHISNPVLTIESGNWNFNRVFISGGTTLKVLAGASIDINTALHISGNGKLIIEDGASVTLTASQQTQCVLECDFGTIEGRIKEQTMVNHGGGTDSYVHFFPIATRLSEINLDDLAQQLMDTLNPGGSLQTKLQISWIDDYDADHGYGFVADHGYYDVANSTSGLNPDLHEGTIVRHYDGFAFTGVGQGFSRPSINSYEFSPKTGVSMIPLYGPLDNSLQDLVSNPQLNGVTAGVSSATAEELDVIATTPEGFNKTFYVQTKAFNPANDHFIVEVEGVYNPSGLPFLMSFSNTKYDFNDDTEYVEGLSPFFERAPILNTPLDLLYGSTFYNLREYDGATKINSSYRGIDFTGLNEIKTSDRSQVVVPRLVDAIKENAPHAARSFYTMDNIISYMPDRKMALDPILSEEYSVYAGRHQPRKIAEYLDFYDHATDEWTTIDLYNIDRGPSTSIDYYGEKLGPILEPSDAVGWNYTNHYDISEYDGNSFSFAEAAVKQYHFYSNMGGQASTIIEDTIVLADHTIAMEKRNTMRTTYNGTSYYQEWMDSYIDDTEFQTLPRSEEYYNILTQQELDAKNEFTLLRLYADYGGDTLELAYLPIAFGTEYVDNELDAFEYSIAPNPAMYLLNNEDGKIGSLRYGSFSKGVQNMSDTLYLVVDRSAINVAFDDPELAGESIEFHIDAPIQQTPDPNWPGWWHGYFQNYSSGALHGYMHTGGFDITLDLDQSISIPQADGDGTESVVEGALFKIHIRPMFGDTNFDGVISTTDILNFLGNFGLNVTDSNEHLDYNGDGVIGNADFLALLSYFGQVYPDNVYGVVDFQTGLQERLKFLAIKRDNNHIAYDWRTYPGFTQAQRDYLASINFTGLYSITDDYGVLIASGGITSNAENNILLPPTAPTTAQLLAGPSNGGALQEGFRIHLLGTQYLDLPGLTKPIQHLCIGCENEDDLFETPPVFTGY